MDSFNNFNLRVEKANAITRHRRLQNITTLFRFIELFLLLVIITGFSVKLPFAVKLPSDYFRELAAALFSPRFVFFVGNVIVVVLFLKSGWLSTRNSSGDNYVTSSDDFCKEFVENSVKSPMVYRAEIEHQREENRVMLDTYKLGERKIYRSRGSENLNRGGGGKEKTHRQVRRSATEICQKSEPAVTSYPEDEMSSEEFRCSVEAFIARQPAVDLRFCFIGVKPMYLT